MFETVIEKESKVEYEVKASKTGENPQTCPVCKEDRKPQNKNKLCFSYNTISHVGRCQNCHRSFYKKDENYKSYVRPVWENKTGLPEKVVDWFLSRFINQETLNLMKITTSVEWMPQVQGDRNVICFNYFREGQLINVKFRDGAKNFKMVKDAEKIFYNLDAIKGQTECYIVEGEMDCLTMVQAGFTNTVSVPNGAGGTSLEYLDNCYRYFEEMTKVYILTDHDEPGEKLANELSRRIGVEKCFRVELGTFKDVNEQLCALGKVDVSNSHQFPLVGVFTVNDHWAEVEYILTHGYPKGWKPRGRLGELISIHPGYTTIITGIPGHGKSEILDQVLIQIAIDYNIKGAFFTPENWPTPFHIIKYVEKLMGKHALKCNALERKKAREFLHDHLYWIYPEEGYSLESILNKVKQAILRYGIQWFVLDPWNKLEHKRNGLSETDYISSSLDIISLFNKKNGTHCFIVAHPTKMKFNDSTGRYEVPGLYDINGSANWYNKADIGLSMYKTEDLKNALHVQKVKFKFWGSVGTVDYNWNSENGRYDEYGSDLTYWLKEQKTKVMDFTEPKFLQDEPTPF